MQIHFNIDSSLRAPIDWRLPALLIGLTVMSFAAFPTCLYGSEASMRDVGLASDLRLVARQRILFGHQSVGSNILDGVEQLASASGVALQIAEVGAAGEVGPATLGHVFVAENGAPLTKLESFRKAVEAGAGALDIALVKFCYVDISSSTDVQSLFQAYRATIDDLQAKHPRTTFIHVTAPLTTAQGGVKALIKRWIGSAPYGILENKRREEYNALLREAYSGREPLFDLARVESSTADGELVSVEWKGQMVPVMAEELTDDGGHLNALGRQRAARELIAVLAAAAGGMPTAGSVK